MAWVKDWSQMGAGLGELRADVREYIDDLFEGVQERVFATYGIVPDYDWPLDSGATPTDDFYPLAELYGANESRTYNLRDDLDGVPSETTFTNRRCDLIQRFMDLLMDRNGATTAFLDHTDNGGNWDGTTGFPPFWSESGILTDIGDATRWKFQRLPAGGGELYAWGENLGLIDTDWPGLRVWLKQQYEILNRLLYTPFTVGWPRDVALPTEFTRNRSVTGPEASEAAAIAQTSIDWAAASPVTLPGGDPNTRPSASYRVTGAATYSTQLNTYVAFANTDTNAEFSYISGLVDFYIDSRVPTEPNMAGGTVFEYDNNGHAGVPAAAGPFSRIGVDAVKATLDEDTQLATATGSHATEPVKPTTPWAAGSTARGYEIHFSSVNGFGIPDDHSFSVVKWDFLRKL